MRIFPFLSFSILSLHSYLIDRSLNCCWFRHISSILMTSNTEKTRSETSTIILSSCIQDNPGDKNILESEWFEWRHWHSILAYFRIFYSRSDLKPLKSIMRRNIVASFLSAQIVNMFLYWLLHMISRNETHTIK